MFTSVIIWIVSGCVVGFIASKLAGKYAEGLALDILLGIVGAVIGGWLFMAAGTAGAINLRSVLVPVISAMVVLAAWHVVRYARPLHA